MRPDTLWERLAKDGRAAPPRGPAADQARTRASILANLRRVLSTRLGSAAAQPELGTPAPCELLLDHPACIPRLQKAIGHCIERYEPRLSAVRVTHVPSAVDALVIRFRITAVLADGTRTPLSFDTRVDDRGLLDLTV